jgi:hypothetical protein
MNIICYVIGNNKEISMTIQKEISHTLQTVMEKNYFQFDQQHYQ